MSNNSNTIDTITEHEACTIAGVSQRTLLRFTEAGYLSVTFNGDGVRLYRSAQLREIFGIPAEAVNVTTEDPSNIETCGANTSFEPNNRSSDIYTADDSLDEVIASTPTPQTGLANSDGELAAEIKRLENLLAIQERILDSKEDEIADLRNQRTWLRQRIEKLEEKSDRDQLLLLSETQTIRSLISYQESRKSGFRQFLEWAGLCKVEPSTKALSHSGEFKGQGAGTQGMTIEVAKAANAD
jgi:hypothetical protein